MFNGQSKFYRPLYFRRLPCFRCICLRNSVTEPPLALIGPVIILVSGDWATATAVNIKKIVNLMVRHLRTSDIGILYSIDTRMQIFIYSYPTSPVDEKKTQRPINILYIHIVQGGFLGGSIIGASKTFCLYYI